MNPFRILFWLFVGFGFEYIYRSFGIVAATLISLVLIVLFYTFLAKWFPVKKKQKKKFSFKFF